MCRILFTGGGVEIKDNPCAVGGTPSRAVVLLPPDPEKAVDRSNCSMLPVETCIRAFPFNKEPAEPPVEYLTAQIKLLPPMSHSSEYGLYVVKNTTPDAVASGSVMTLSVL